jgi:hypothetical protein
VRARRGRAVCVPLGGARRGCLRARRSSAAQAACPSGYAVAWPSSPPARCRRRAGRYCRRTCIPR